MSVVTTTCFEKQKKRNHILYKFEKRTSQNVLLRLSPVFVCCMILTQLSKAQGFCGDSIKWSHNVNIEDVYGMWYGVGYAQHTPDMTNKPNEVGCLTLYITDATTESHDDWLDWSIIKKNYSDENWRSDKSLPWSDTALSGSWLNVRIKRKAQKEVLNKEAERYFNSNEVETSLLNAKQKTDLNKQVENGRKNKRILKYKGTAKDINHIIGTKALNSRRTKRDIYNERRIRVIWDEDGQSLEQTYLYTNKEPGLWVADKRPMLEREMRARGIELWYPDNPPRHPQVIKILKVTPDSLTINHCSELGGGGVFSLILQRSPSKIKYWEWYNIKRQLFNFDLPNIYRYTTICSGCAIRSSLMVLFMCLAIVLLRLIVRF